MPSTTFDISLPSNGSPAAQGCKPGDKLKWTNNTGQTITGFTLPGCVPPQPNPAPIAVGATTQAYTVNNGSNGSYSYSYVLPSLSSGTRSGTVDVGAK